MTIVFFSPLLTGAQSPSASPKQAGRAQNAPASPGKSVTNPILIRIPDPKYLPNAIAAGIEGFVELQVSVLPDGTVGETNVLQSLDSFYGLDAESVRSAKLAVFKPGIRLSDARPIPVVATLVAEFTRKGKLGLPESIVYAPLRPMAAGMIAPKPIRTGGAKYSAAAIRARVQGTVEVEAIVTVDGHVKPVRVTKSLPYGLDAAAVDVMKKYWVYYRGTLNGRPVPTLVKLSQQFTLPRMPAGH